MKDDTKSNEASASRGSAYDRELALSRVGNNPAIADELLGLMLAEFPDQRRALLQSLESADFASLRRLAHRLRGSAGCCGMRSLDRACHAIELAVDNNSDQDLPILVELTVEQMDEVMTQFDKG